MKLTLGSTSVHKHDALQEACHRIGLTATVTAIKAASGQNEQPVGLRETHRGALTRALGAQEYNPDRYAVGIESGIFRFDGITLDMAVIVVLTPQGQEIVTTSAAVRFPEVYVDIAEERGFETTTVGSVVAEMLGGDATDPHATLTHGAITRSATLVDALVVALRQL